MLVSAGHEAEGILDRGDDRNRRNQPIMHQPVLGARAQPVQQTVIEAVRIDQDDRHLVRAELRSQRPGLEQLVQGGGNLPTGGNREVSVTGWG